MQSSSDPSSLLPVNHHVLILTPQFFSTTRDSSLISYVSLPMLAQNAVVTSISCFLPLGFVTLV